MKGLGAASILDPGLAVGFIEVVEQVCGKEQRSLVEVSGELGLTQSAAQDRAGRSGTRLEQTNKY